MCISKNNQTSFQDTELSIAFNLQVRSPSILLQVLENKRYDVEFLLSFVEVDGAHRLFVRYADFPHRR